jgi:hypothetical protein
MANTPPQRPRPSAQNRPDDGLAGEGLRVKLDPIPGLTPKRLMPRSGFYFQCPPLEEFSHDHNFSHMDYDTPRRGQFSRKGGRQLRTVSFDTLVVDQGSFTILGRDIKIEEFVERLVKISDRGDPFVLTVAHMMPPHGYSSWGKTLAGPELQMMATLRNVTISEKAGEGDARYISVDFVEYREALVQQRKLGEDDSKREDWPKVVELRKDGRAEEKGTGFSIGRPPLKPVTLHLLAQSYYREPRYAQYLAGYRKNKIKNWGNQDALIDYFLYQRRTNNWPVKIHIPKPPDGLFESELS